MTWLFRLFCGLRKQHYYIRHFDMAEKRLFTSCLHCGATQPGYVLDGKPPRKRYDGETTRHQIKRSA